MAYKVIVSFLKNDAIGVDWVIDNTTPVLSLHPTTTSARLLLLGLAPYVASNEGTIYWQGSVGSTWFVMERCVQC